MSIRIKERCSTGECTENDSNSKGLYYRAECVTWVNNDLGNTEKGDVNTTLGWIRGLVVTQGSTGGDIKTGEALNVVCTEVLSITVFISFVIQEEQRSAAFENREIEKSFICFVHQKIRVFLSHRSYLPLLQESHAGCNPSGWKPLGPTLNGIEPSPKLPFVHTTLGAGTELSPGVQRQRSSSTYFLTEFNQQWAINCQFQPRGTLTSSYPWALLLSWARGCPPCLLHR